jgi:hypothetical protein
MTLLRRELKTYTSACEQILSDGLDPELTGEERDLIIYYAKELFDKFDQKRDGGSDNLYATLF